MHSTKWGQSAELESQEKSTKTVRTTVQKEQTNKPPGLQSPEPHSTISHDLLHHPPHDSMESISRSSAPTEPLDTCNPTAMNDEWQCQMMPSLSSSPPSWLRIEPSASIEECAYISKIPRVRQTVLRRTLTQRHGQQHDRLIEQHVLLVRARMRRKRRTRHRTSRGEGRRTKTKKTLISLKRSNNHLHLFLGRILNQHGLHTTHASDACDTCCATLRECYIRRNMSM